MGWLTFSGVCGEGGKSQVRHEGEKMGMSRKSLKRRANQVVTCISRWAGDYVVVFGDGQTAR